MQIRVLHREEYGNDRYHPHCALSKGILSAFNKKTFTNKQLTILVGVGFKVILDQEKHEFTGENHE